MHKPHKSRQRDKSVPNVDKENTVEAVEDEVTYRHYRDIPCIFSGVLKRLKIEGK